MARRRYTNQAPSTTLTQATDTLGTSLPVGSTAGYPAVPFTVGLERGTPANEEICLCTALTATTLTVTRGYDGTTAKAHAVGAKVEHCVVGMDFSEINTHIFDTTRDDHTQYYNAARLATARNEIWTGTALPTTGNFEGRTVYATNLTNTWFRDLFYVYRNGAWGLLSIFRWSGEHIASPDFGGAASTYYDLVAGDWGAVPCAVNVVATSYLLARTNTNAGTLYNIIRNSANVTLAYSVSTSAAGWHQPIHIFRRLAYASGATMTLKNTILSDQAFTLTRTDGNISPKFLIEVQ